MGGSARPAFRRRQWIVNRPLQYRFTGIMLLVLGLSVLCVLGGVYVALWTSLSTFQLLNDPITVALVATAGVMISLEMIVFAPIMIWVGIRLTHRVAGPLVRIHAALTRMQAGDFDLRIQLRKGDALTELADDVNQLAASLRERASK